MEKRQKNKISRRLFNQSPYQTNKNKLPRFPIEAINVMKQVRETFIKSEEEELAENISQFGLIQPVSIAIFDTNHMREHLRIVNKAWGIRSTINHYTKYDDSYPILIAGERRFRAIKRILADTQGQYSQEHFKDRKIPTSFHYNISSLAFISIQVSENIHRRPPAHEEAAYFERYYRALRLIRGKKFSIPEFAREVGRSANSVREAIKFCYLPNEIRKKVKDKDITYSIACELARLQNDGMDNKSLEQWAIDCYIHQYNVQIFQKRVSDFLIRKNSKGLFDDFSQAEENQARKERRKKALDYHLRKALSNGIKYIETIKGLDERGLIATDISPFATETIFKGIGDEIKSLESLIPLLEKHSKNPVFKKMLKKIGHSNMIEEIKELDERYKKIG